MAAETIPTKYRLRVKQRLAVIRYVETYGIKPASRYFGLARHTVRRWWRDWQRAGEPGLVPRYPKRRTRRISENVVALIRTRALSLSTVPAGRGFGSRVSTRFA